MSFEKSSDQTYCSQEDRIEQAKLRTWAALEIKALRKVDNSIVSCNG